MADLQSEFKTFQDRIALTSSKKESLRKARNALREKIRKHFRETLKLSRNHLSLDAPLKQGENNRLIDFIEDELQPSPDSELLDESLSQEIRRVLKTLTPREAEILSLYFGIKEDRSYTLEEIGQKFNLTRERIRQIKEKAIRKLRHASRSRRLRSYLN